MGTTPGDITTKGMADPRGRTATSSIRTITMGTTTMAVAVGHTPETA